MNKASDDTKGSAQSNYLSRSALAEKLGVTLKELTQLMIESGWLLHNEAAEKGKEWQLTAKGEFEGGIYRESKKFGQYIVWPESVLAHAAISPLSDTCMNATRVAQAFDVTAKVMNRIFADMAWVKPYAKGWQLTELGQANGGVQESNKDTGVPYVMWQRHITDNTGLQHYMQGYHGDENSKLLINEQLYYLALSGHYVASKPELQIANYLYLFGFQFAYRRTVFLALSNPAACSDQMLTDFYLPKANVHIHYQAQDISPPQLAKQLERQQRVKTHQLNVIELSVDDIVQLDQVLARKLLQLGITDEQ